MTKKAIVTHLRQHEKYERLIAATKDLQPLTTAVAHPCDETSLRGALEAAEAGIITPILVGPKTRICDLAKSLDLDIEGIDIIDVPDSHAAAEKAVETVRAGKAQLLMKGSLHSDELAGGGHQAGDWTSHRPAYQPRLRHGRSDPSTDAVHHRRRGEHRA